MLCQNCKQKNECKALCQEAERYVGQDRSPQREMVLSKEVIELAQQKPWDCKKIVRSEQVKRLIIALASEGKTHQEIAYHLPVSRQYISKFLRGVQPKINVTY